MSRVISLRPAPPVSVEAPRYADVPPVARLRFDAIAARVAALRPTFTGSFTTPAKLEDGKRVVAELEREVKLLRESLK